MSKSRNDLKRDYGHRLLKNGRNMCNVSGR